MERRATGAVILTGGGAVRLDGADKASVELAGLTLLEHALGAVVDIDEVVVVGDQVPTTRPVTFTREDPAGGGPAAGLLAGLRAFARRPAWVMTLAVDMPLVTSMTVRRLLDAARGESDDGANELPAPYDGAALIDDSRRLQYLCAVYATDALERNRPPYEDEFGLSMRDLVRGLRIEHVPAIGPETQDVDTWADLLRLREALGD